MKFSIFIKRFYPYLKPNLFRLIVVSITMILATTLEAYLPEATGKIIDDLFKQNNDNLAVFYALIIFGVIFLSSIFAFIATNISSLIANKIIMVIRVEMFAKLLKLPKKYFDTNASGKILTKITYNVEQISSMASTIWIELIKASLSVIILISYLFWKNWQLSLSLLIVLPIIFLMVKSSAERMKKSSILVQKSVGEITHHLSENISANTIVKIYQTFSSSTAKFNKLANIIRQKRFRVDNISAINTFAVNTLIGILLALVVYFSSTSLKMSSGEFIAFFTAMGMLIKPAKTLVGINKPLQQALVSGKVVFELLDEKEEPNKGKQIAIKGKIEFKNVSFAYNKKLILQNINLVINQGKSLALVGSTGSGKSTIVQLITKLYTHTSGDIFIDDIKIEALSLDCLRKNIALVEQKTNLFSGTIGENIDINQKLNLKELQNVANIADASDFINNLESGMSSIIGNNAVQLSGGQAQRLSIARAVAKNAPILILDEATASLDSKTEREVQNAINKIQIGRTTIIIAHRLSTIINADKIAVLKDGKIVEVGTHEQLLKIEGEYQKLYKMQFKN